MAFVFLHPLQIPYKLSLMLIGVLTLMTVNQHQATVFISATTLSCGLPRRIKVVSRSSAEAEYRTLASPMTNISWIQSLLHELHIVVPTPIIHYDNLGVVLLTTNPVMDSRTKHFELDLHYIHDKVKPK